MKYETALHMLHPGTGIVGSTAEHYSFNNGNLTGKFAQSYEPEGMSSLELSKIKLQQTEPTFQQSLLIFFLSVILEDLSLEMLN